EYLKKIVQVSFEVPEIDKSLLPEILKGRLSEIIHKNDCKEKFENNNYFETVLENCVNPYIKNIRDINRLINAFQFKYGALWEETSFVDLLAITAIEIFEPKLYKWIFNNKDFICRGDINSSLRRHYNPSRYIEKCNQEFESLGLYNKMAFDIVSILFPTFAYDTNHKLINEDISELELISRKRIGSTKTIGLYFSFNLSDIKIPREEIIKCVNSYSRLRLLQKVREFNRDGNILYFLENVYSLFRDNKISNNRFALIASVLLVLQNKFVNQSRLADYHSNNIVVNMITSIKEEKVRYEIINFTVKHIDKTNISTRAILINQILQGCIKSDNEDKNLQIITLEHLKNIGKIYVEKIKSIANSKNILSLDEFDKIFYLWKELDRESAKVYVENLFKDDVNKLKFLCLTTYNSLTGWEFYSENCFNLVSEEEFYDSIKKFDKSRLDEFTKEEQIKLASFTINYENRDNDHFLYAQEKQAIELIKKWKSESSLAK
ncbi:MAG: hypothetical protein N4S07_06315, partial [Lactobacillus iners]|nr:hypothetical protein [Lactobacillus iners]